MGLLGYQHSLLNIHSEMIYYPVLNHIAFSAIGIKVQFRMKVSTPGHLRCAHRFHRHHCSNSPLDSLSDVSASAAQASPRLTAFLPGQPKAARHTPPPPQRAPAVSSCVP